MKRMRKTEKRGALFLLLCCLWISRTVCPAFAGEAFTEEAARTESEALTEEAARTEPEALTEEAVRTEPEALTEEAARTEPEALTERVTPAESGPAAGALAPGSAAGSDATEPSDTPPEEEYVENEWGFVEGTMDISGGIPADAPGLLARIREKGELRVATEPYFAPQEFIDPEREGQESYVGADMELARLIARRMGVELEIVPMEFTDVLSAVAAGEVDLAISALSYTPGRAALMELSMGYYYADSPAGAGLLIREGEPVFSPDDLAGRDIVAQQGSLQELLMAENVRLYRQFRRVSTVGEVYDALLDGTADAAAVDVQSAALYIGNNPGCGLALVDGVSFELEPQFGGDRIAAPKGEIALLYFVNSVISEVLADGTYQEWYDRYTLEAARLGL